MPWMPDPREPEATFEEPIITNALALIEDVFAEALEHYFDSENYPDFAERSLGQIIKNEFPCFAIGPRSNATAPADDNSHIIEVVGFNCYLGVIGDSAAEVTTKIMRYVKVLNSVLRSGLNDLREGLSNPFGLVIESITHDYGPIGERESIYFRSAIVEVTVSLRER